MSTLSSIFSSTSRGIATGSGQIYFGMGPNGEDIHFSFSTCEDAVKAYRHCPPVTAIINRKAQAYGGGKTWLLDKDGKQVTKAVNNLQKLLLRPNPLQSWDAFEAQGYIYQQLFEYNVVLAIKPAGFDNTYAKMLWNIPGNFLDIELKKRFTLTGDSLSLKDYIESVHFVYGGDRTKLPLEDIYIFKGNTPSFDNMVLPESRLRSLSDPINNIIAAFESRRVLLNRRGALGILSNGGKDAMGMMPLDPAEKETVQKELMRYGLKQSQWQVIVTSAALTWQQMGYPTKELMLFEEIDDNIMRICDSYNYPHYLLSRDKGTTFDNLKEAKVLLYQDAILPESGSTYGQWNHFFSLDRYGIRLDKDYSHVQALQKDKVQEATARKTLNEALKVEYEQGLITLNQWLEKLGEDPLPGTMGEVRATDPKTSTVPLALTIGVGGVQSLISVITASGMSEDARRATLEILFGIDPKDAARMAAGGNQQEQEGNTGTGNNNQNEGGEDE
jgi:hypothetical protein